MPFEYQFRDRGAALQAYKMAKQYYNKGSRDVIMLQNSTIILGTDDTSRLESIIEKFNAGCKRRRIVNNPAPTTHCSL